MTRLFITFLLAIAIMIPTLSVEAADVPDFLYVANANYVGIQNSPRKGYRSYDYDCDLSYGDLYVDSYIRLLLNNYPFVYIGNRINDARRTSAQAFVYNYFSYRGGKAVGSANFGSNRNPIYCEVLVEVCYYYQMGVQRVKICVANGLTYG